MAFSLVMNLNVTKIAFLKSKSYNDESVFIAFTMNKLFSATDNEQKCFSDLLTVKIKRV